MMFPPPWKQLRTKRLNFPACRWRRSVRKCRNHGRLKLCVRKLAGSLGNGLISIATGMASGQRYPDKVVIVTGGTSGIGEGIVREFGEIREMEWEEEQGDFTKKKKVFGSLSAASGMKLLSSKLMCWTGEGLDEIWSERGELGMCSEARLSGLSTFKELPFPPTLPQQHPLSGDYTWTALPFS